MNKILIILMLTVSTVVFSAMIFDNFNVYAVESQKQRGTVRSGPKRVDKVGTDKNAFLKNPIRLFFYKLGVKPPSFLFGNHVNHFFEVFRLLFHQVNCFAFEMTKETFRTSIIPAIAFSRDDSS